MDWEWLLRISVALGLSGVLGFEREASRKSAGLRTHMLVGAGAALFTLVSLDIPGADPARLAAGVVTGVGFLGAGVIFRRGGSVRGLTTAATLWLVAALGITVGVGRLAEASLATALALTVLSVWKAVEFRPRPRGDGLPVTIRAEGHRALRRALSALTELDVPVSMLDLTSETPTARASIPSGELDRFWVRLADIDGVTVEIGNREPIEGGLPGDAPGDAPVRRDDDWPT